MKNEEESIMIIYCALKIRKSVQRHMCNVYGVYRLVNVNKLLFEEKINRVSSAMRIQMCLFHSE